MAEVGALNTERPGRFDVAFWGVTALPYVLLFAFILAFAVDVPFSDDWMLLHDLEKIDQGTWAVADLLAQHFDHRLAFPKLLMIAIALLSKWNPVFQCLASAVLAGLTLAGLFVMLRSSVRDLLHDSARWQLVVCAWLLFSLHQWRNWLWGWQVQILMSACALTWMLAALSAEKVRPVRLAGAGALAAVSSFSFASGLIAWPLGFLLLVARRNRDWKRLATWAVLSGVTFGVFFYGYSFSRVSQQGVAAPADPWELCTILGTPLVGVNAAAPFAGLLGLTGFVLACVWMVRDRSRVAPAPPLVCLGLYGLASALAVAVGRIPMGRVSPRHVTCVVPLWLSVVTLSYLVARTRDQRRGGGFELRKAWGWLAAGLVLAVGFSQIQGLRAGAAWSAELTAARESLIRGEQTDKLAFYVPNSRLATGVYRRKILAMHLSVFRDPRVAERARAEAGAPLALAIHKDGPDRLRIRVTGGQPGRVLQILARVSPAPAFILYTGTVEPSCRTELVVPLPAKRPPVSLDLLAAMLNRAGAVELSPLVQVKL